MALLNYTTHVAAAKTVGEIMGILTAHGARAILQADDDHGAITGLRVQIDVGEPELGFRLPADWCAVLRVMERDRRVPRRLKTHEQARRVAWRILKDWIEAQIKPAQKLHQFLSSMPTAQRYGALATISWFLSNFDPAGEVRNTHNSGAACACQLSLSVG